MQSLNTVSIINKVDIPNTAEAKQLKQACDDFESFFMQQLLDISLKSTNVGGEGAGSDIIKGMYSETMSKSTGGNLGISDMLLRFLVENNPSLSKS
jgi:Rod binding domain-containing protein